MNNLDIKFNRNCLFTIVLAFILWLGGNTIFPTKLGYWTFDKIIEQIQSIMLLAIAIYSYFYAKRFPKSSDEQKFWYWTILWWFLIFARGISWGREFFPRIDHSIYRVISIFVIGAPIITMFLPSIRRQIHHRFWSEKIPVWHVILAFLFLGISDVIEHHRIGNNLLLFCHERKDLLEELMEIPCFLSLIFVVLYLQHNERINHK